MDESAVDKVIDALTPLAAKIGEGASHVYALAVRQVVIEGCVGIVVGLLLLATAFFGGRFVFRAVWRLHAAASDKSRTTSYSSGYYGGFAVGAYGSIVAAFVVGVIGLTFLAHAAVSLANPEFAAIQRLLWTVAS